VDKIVVLILAWLLEHWYLVLFGLSAAVFMFWFESIVRSAVESAMKNTVLVELQGIYWELRKASKTVVSELQHMKAEIQSVSYKLNKEVEGDMDDNGG
jgi:hypothetical protein